jgi:hypothetical protein
MQFLSCIQETDLENNFLGKLQLKFESYQRNIAVFSHVKIMDRTRIPRAPSKLKLKRKEIQ